MLDRGLRLPTVLGVLAVAGVLSWGFGRWWISGGHSPLRVGWFTGVLLLGMAAVVVQTRAAGHPTVSLYANDYNEAALRMYRRVGFDQVGTFATVMY